MEIMKYLVLILMLLPAALLAQDSIMVGLPAPAKKPAIAILPFEGRGISTDLALVLSDRIRAELIATDAYSVMERAEMERILKEQAFQLTGACSEASCIRQVGQLIAVTKMVGGSVSMVGDLYMVDARLIDVETGTIERNVVEDFGGNVEELLTRIMGKVARKLSGVETMDRAIYAENADLYVRSEPAGGAIIIDDQPTGLVTPATIRRLTVESHKVRVEKDNLAKDTTIALKPNVMGTVSLTLAQRLARLKLDGTPAGAAIMLNDTTKFGYMPITDRKTEFGQYRFLVKAKGYHSQYYDLKVDKESNYSLSINLKRKSRPLAMMKSLVLPG
ncbi:MAG: PEGA domain-containing protein, partial [Candidatus Edwardsbacteria bacterium]|nr:PEGA domain-containing protein [Candidatus Edwardsbacteria bacterium]